jgi:hypothetical protein
MRKARMARSDSKQRSMMKGRVQRLKMGYSVVKTCIYLTQKLSSPKHIPQPPRAIADTEQILSGSNFDSRLPNQKQALLGKVF